MLLVTLMRCVTGGPPGDSAVPLAGDSLSCMNFGTAACVHFHELGQCARESLGKSECGGLMVRISAVAALCSMVRYWLCS